MGGGYLELHSGIVVPWTTARVVAEDVQNGKHSDQLYFINLLFHQLFTFFSISFLHNKVFRGLTSPVFAAFWPKIASHTKNISSTKRTNAENIFTQGLIFESAGRALTWSSKISIPDIRLCCRWPWAIVVTKMIGAVRRHKSACRSWCCALGMPMRQDHGDMYWPVCQKKRGHSCVHFARHEYVWR